MFACSFFEASHRCMQPWPATVAPCVCCCLLPLSCLLSWTTRPFKTAANLLLPVLGLILLAQSSPDAPCAQCHDEWAVCPLYTSIPTFRSRHRSEMCFYEGPPLENFKSPQLKSPRRQMKLHNFDRQCGGCSVEVLQSPSGHRLCRRQQRSTTPNEE